MTVLLSIYLRFVGMTISWVVFLWFIVIESIQIYCINIFSRRILIILYKIITGISDETRNNLTIYETLCRNVAIFDQQKLAS